MLMVLEFMSKAEQLLSNIWSHPYFFDHNFGSSQPFVYYRGEHINLKSQSRERTCFNAISIAGIFQNF
jgi:hypothetical protein